MIWNRLKTWVCGLYGRMAQSKEAPRAILYYAALLRWGRFSGLRHEPNETPREYGLRLTNHFPKLRHEIELIVEMFQSEVYGEETLGSKELGAMRKALRKLRTPGVWPFRLKSLLHST